MNDNREIRNGFILNNSDTFDEEYNNYMRKLNADYSKMTDEEAMKSDYEGLFRPQKVGESDLAYAKAKSNYCEKQAYLDPNSSKYNTLTAKIFRKGKQGSRYESAEAFEKRKNIDVDEDGNIKK